MTSCGYSDRESRRRTQRDDEREYDGDEQITAADVVGGCYGDGR